MAEAITCAHAQKYLATILDLMRDCWRDSSKNSVLEVISSTGAIDLSLRNYHKDYTCPIPSSTCRGAPEVNYVRFLFAISQGGPAGEGTAGEEGFGGPFAEVDGESDAVAVVAG